MRPKPVASLIRSLRQLPNSLLVTLSLFAVLPVWSLSFVDAAGVLGLRDGPLSAGLTAATYWLLPLAICVAIGRRSFLFLPFFVAECGALIGSSLQSNGDAGSGLLVSKFALLGLTVMLGTVFLQKDLLFPFMAQGKRFWRHAPRLFANLRMHMKVPGGEFACILEDCSLTGMALSMSSKAAPHLATLGAHDEVAIHVAIKGETLPLGCRIVWQRGVGELLRVGVTVANPAAMQAVISAASEASSGGSGPLSRALARLWVSSAFRRGALTLFGISLASSFGMPACGTQPAQPVVKSSTRTPAGNAAVLAARARTGSSFGLDGGGGDAAGGGGGKDGGGGGEEECKGKDVKCPEPKIPDVFKGDPALKAANDACAKAGTEVCDAMFKEASCHADCTAKTECEKEEEGKEAKVCCKSKVPTCCEEHQALLQAGLREVAVCGCIGLVLKKDGGASYGACMAAATGDVGGMCPGGGEASGAGGTPGASDGAGSGSNMPGGGGVCDAMKKFLEDQKKEMEAQMACEEQGMKAEAEFELCVEEHPEKPESSGAPTPQVPPAPPSPPSPSEPSATPQSPLTPMPTAEQSGL